MLWAASPRAAKPDSYESLYPRKRYKFEPTGILHVEVWESYLSRSQKTWSDSQRARLEDRVPECAAGMVKLALEDRAARRKREAEERERQRMPQEQARLEQQIEEEEARVTALEKAAAAWTKAQRIRFFVAAVETGAAQAGQPAAQGSPLANWLDWARQQADRLDPLVESPPSVLDRKATPAERPSYEWPPRKPKPVVRWPQPLWNMR